MSETEDLLGLLSEYETRLARYESKTEEALVRAERAERSLSAFLDMMGWEYEPLPLGEEAIRAMLDDIENVLSRSPTLVDVVELRKWARTLLRLTPSYLSLVARELRLDTPWRPFLDLASHLIQKAEVDQVASAPLLYGALDVARRNAQQAGYLWALEQQGRLPGPPPLLGDTIDERVLEIHTYLFQRR